MKMKCTRVAWLVLAAAANSAFSQSNIYQNCSEIITSGLRNYSIRTDSASYLNTVFDDGCEKTGEKKGVNIGLSLDAIIKSIPVKFTGSYESSEEAMRNFCRNYAAVAASRTEATRYEETIVERAYQSLDQCLAIAQSGVIIRHDVRNDEFLDFFVAPGFGHPVTIRGVSASKNIVCHAQDPNDKSPITKRVNASSRIVLTNNQTLNMTCQRSTTTLADGTKAYDEGVVTVMTDILPNGNYSAFVPRDAVLPELIASNIQKRTALVESSNADAQNRLTAIESHISRLGSISGGVTGEPGTGGGAWDMQAAVCPPGSYVSGVAPLDRIRAKYGDAAITAVKVTCSRLGGF